MSFRWGEETTLKFVLEYLEHECLWNCKSPLYKNKQARQSAYNDLETAMNISGFDEKEIKKKIKNIRSTYSQEKKKIKDSKSSFARTGTLYVPSVKWFTILEAALCSEVRESQSNMPSLYSTDEGSRSPAGTEPAEDPEFGELEPPIKKQKPSTVVRESKGITETINFPVEDNEFEIFGKHVGLQLKSLPLLLALDAQEHIQLYLNKIRRRHLKQSSGKNRVTRALMTSDFVFQDSPYSPTSSCNDNSSEQNRVRRVHSPASTSCSDSIYFNDTTLEEKQSTPESKDIISSAMNIAHVRAANHSGFTRRHPDSR